MLCDSLGVKKLLAPWPYAPEAVETYGRALEKAMRDGNARAVLCKTVNTYESGEELDIRAVLKEMDKAAEASGESAYTMRVLPYLCMLEPARTKYAAAGLSEELYVDSFADLLWKTRECYKIYGVYGSFVAAWFYRFFALKCFALGRLQFEYTAFKAAAPLGHGAQVINVHIPSSGPLRKADCESSYERAASFFDCNVGGKTPFVCDSWLLHPLCAELPPDSAIRRFASDYELLEVIEDPSCADMWILFGKSWNGELSALPENTTLQRIFKKHLLAGGSVGRGYGFYLRTV